MRIRQSEHLYQLTWMPKLFPVNCYLVEEEDGLTLIDAGMGFSAKGILRTAAELGRPITRIVLTHGHGDHVGALDSLVRLLPEAKVYISERDARLLAGDRSLLPGEAQTPVKGAVPKNVRTRADVLLRDGDRIGALLAVSSPGHTPGSMSFQDTRTGALIAGDAYQTFRRTAVSGTMVPGFPFPAMATWDKKSALDSSQKLLKTEPTLLAVGHGDMIAEPARAMEAAIVQAARLLGKELA